MLTAPRERRLVGNGEVETHDPEQRVQEPFGLAQREMVDEPQGQSGLDGEIRVAPLPTPPAAPPGRPGSDRFRGHPHRHIAAANEGLVIGRPVRHAVLRLIRGMDLRLHPGSVAPAEGHEKCGPRRPTHSGSSCNNAAHWEGLAACDLFTVEVLTLAGLRRYLVFFVIALKTRRVHIAGIHTQPGGAWMEQQARNVTDPVDGCLRRARHLIHDRDPLYTRVFGEILESAGVQPIRLPPKSPNLNAYAERFVRSIKEECLTRVAPLGEGHLRRLVYEYREHDHRERNHQGLDNQLLQRPPLPRRPDADVRRRVRLGGLLSFYNREAA